MKSLKVRPSFNKSTKLAKPPLVMTVVESSYKPTRFMDQLLAPSRIDCNFKVEAPSQMSLAKLKQKFDKQRNKVVSVDAGDWHLQQMMRRAFTAWLEVQYGGDIRMARVYCNRRLQRGVIKVFIMNRQHAKRIKRFKRNVR